MDNPILTRKVSFQSKRRKEPVLLLPHNKNEGKQNTAQIPGSCKRTDKVLEHEGDSDTN